MPSRDSLKTRFSLLFMSVNDFLWMEIRDFLKTWKKLDDFFGV